MKYSTVTVEGELKSGDSISIAVLSDLHVDSTKFNLHDLKEKLSDVDYAVILGDVADWITHKDDRFLPENDATPAADAFLSKRIEYVYGIMRSLGPKILFIGYGNHETSLIKHVGVDPLAELCKSLGCELGGYCGTLDVVGRTVGGRSVRFRLGYHHGRWGGYNDKGYSGAKRFFDSFEGYDAFAYGHNHASRCDVIRRLSVSGSKHDVRDVLIINCSCQVNSVNGGSVASYEYVHGHAPVANVVNVLHLRARCSRGNWDFKKSLEIRM